MDRNANLALGRRHLIAGALASTALWVAPSVLTLDSVEAAVGSSCATLVNLAPAGIATQSSVAFGGVPQRGNDGNVNGSYWGLSVIHTANEFAAWWQVDLGASYNITEVRLWNRTDCCSTRTRDVQVFVDGTLVGIDPGVTGRPSVVPVHCAGQIIRVVNGNTIQVSMQLAEIEVMGC